ncbi:GDSL esterase/lipase At5g03610-like [Asparagus officinalis]|uniref:GDSL esterase/lipase At5g03610-like n=1 Tax=Asparagus officinalis TaxID=4686 RepID=UPI00098DF96C|nr:GDSL esterase/lipase At5g03610-like [Asparagus officinalis]
MKSLFFIAFLFALLAITLTEVNGCDHHGHHKKYGHRKLFVFGDSYADTGNMGKIGERHSRPWYEPYGMSYPHRPAGRFSDGIIFTDYLATYLRLRTPTPYKYRKLSTKHPYGMNFAVGGSGVFYTPNDQRKLSAQIDAFQAQINENVFSHHDVKSSVVYVAISGNDYSFYANNHSLFDVYAYCRNVTTELTVQLKRLAEIGVGKVLVANISPLECTPTVTRSKSNYTKCDLGYSLGTSEHNILLSRFVGNLTQEIKSTQFLLVDLYNAFKSVIDTAHNGTRKFEHIMRPCCEPTTDDFDCGWVDNNGQKLYSLCSNPQDYFFFDTVHPTQAGWGAVFENLVPWLKKNL